MSWNHFPEYEMLTIMPLLIFGSLMLADLPIQLSILWLAGIASMFLGYWSELKMVERGG
jgi:hypothetical protein